MYTVGNLPACIAARTLLETEMKRKAKFEDLWQRGLETVYDAEARIVTALPKMIAACSSQELSEALSNHLEQTRQQVIRLEKIFEQMGQEPRSRESQGLSGLLLDGENLISEIEKSATLDVALAAAAREVEHWEMVAYESLSEIAEMLGQEDAVKLLQETLDEESEAADILNEVATSVLNGDAEADETGGEEDDEEVESEV